jgi:hypothetical protein
MDGDEMSYISICEDMGDKLDIPYGLIHTNLIEPYMNKKFSMSLNTIYLDYIFSLDKKGSYFPRLYAADKPYVRSAVNVLTHEGKRIMCPEDLYSNPIKSFKYNNNIYVITCIENQYAASKFKIKNAKIVQTILYIGSDKDRMNDIIIKSAIQGHILNNPDTISLIGKDAVDKLICADIEQTIGIKYTGGIQHGTIKHRHMAR